MKVVVVDTGAANLASVLAALARVGADVRRTRDPEEVTAAERVVLPGVGAFGAVRRRLSEPMADALIERVRVGRPTLGICLGMQLMAEISEESPAVRGLGVLPVEVRGFQGAPSVPQLGWNGVSSEECPWIRPGTAYYANSFRLAEVPAGWSASYTTHGERFVASLSRGSVLLCQFHPELSGEWGLDLLGRWVRGGSESGVSAPVAASLTRRIIPCLDVREGRVVKGVQFSGLRDAGDPAELALAYARQGADELCMLDVSATTEGRGTALETVRRIRARINLPLTVGGGVRSVDDARRLLDAGADKVAVNSAAVVDPDLLARLSQALGRQCVVLAVDAAGTTSGWEVVTRSGRVRTGLDAVAWCRRAEALGAGEVLLTSWDRDGTRSGYDLDLVGAVASAVRIPVIASGGASRAEHLALAFGAGAQAALAASIFHDRDTTVGRIKDELSALSIAIRSSRASSVFAGGAL